MTPVSAMSTSPNTWEASTRDLSCVDNSTPHVPLHLHGTKRNIHSEGVNLLSQPQAGHLNYQPVISQEHSAVAIQNAAPGSGTPQTPQQSGASIASPIWHISPQSDTKQSLGTHASLVRIQGYQGLSTDNTEHEKIQGDPQLPSASKSSEEVPCITNLEESSKKHSLDQRCLTEESRQAQSPTTPHDTVQQTPALTVKTPQNQAAAKLKSYTPSLVDNTDAFLAYMKKTMKDGSTRGKRYVALNPALQSEGKETDASMNHESEASPTIQTPHKENIPLSSTPNNAISALTGLKAVKHSDIAVDTTSHVGNQDMIHQNQKLPVSQTIHDPTVSMVATDILSQDNAIPAGIKATQDRAPNIATHPMPLQVTEAQFQQARAIHKALMSEILAIPPVNPNAPKLTEESLIQNGGWPARHRSGDSFCDKISDTGVETKKENVRASQGRDAADELRNRSSWYPHIPDWEQKNWALDASYVPTYIEQDWLPSTTDWKDYPVDTNTEGFKLGKLPVNDRVLGAEVIQPSCIPG